MYPIWTNPSIGGAHIGALSENETLTLEKVRTLPLGWANVVMRVHFGTTDAVQKAQEENDPIFNELVKRKKADRITLMLVASAIAFGILLVAAAAHWL